jgi:hypothetical protein
MNPNFHLDGEFRTQVLTYVKRGRQVIPVQLATELAFTEDLQRDHAAVAVAPFPSCGCGSDLDSAAGEVEGMERTGPTFLRGLPDIGLRKRLISLCCSREGPKRRGSSPVLLFGR